MSKDSSTALLVVMNIGTVINLFGIIFNMILLTFLIGDIDTLVALFCHFIGLLFSLPYTVETLKRWKEKRLNNEQS